jgi:hypothetical protein
MIVQTPPRQICLMDAELGLAEGQVRIKMVAPVQPLPAPGVGFRPVLVKGPTSGQSTHDP